MLGAVVLLPVLLLEAEEEAVGWTGGNLVAAAAEVCGAAVLVAAAVSREGPEAAVCGSEGSWEEAADVGPGTGAVEEEEEECVLRGVKSDVDVTVVVLGGEAEVFVLPDGVLNL